MSEEKRLTIPLQDRFDVAVIPTQQEMENMALAWDCLVGAHERDQIMLGCIPGYVAAHALSASGVSTQDAEYGRKNWPRSKENMTILFQQLVKTYIQHHKLEAPVDPFLEFFNQANKTTSPVHPHEP